MASFRLLKPFAVVRSGKVLHYTRYGSVVELSESDAKQFVDEGRLEPVSKTEAKKAEKELKAADEAAPPAPAVVPPPVGGVG